MKIVIDVSPIVYETGTSWYTLRLIENLSKIAGNDTLVLFGGSLRRRNELFEKTSDIKAEKSFWYFPPSMLDLIWNRMHILPVEYMVGSNDIFHSSDWTCPPTKGKKVTTVHDLTPIKFPQDSDPLVVAVHTRRLAWVKKEVDLVIVPSISTFKDLVRYGVSREKIRVIPEALVFKNTMQKTESAKICKKLGVDKPYLLAVGGAPRKNLARIMEAYLSLAKDRSDLELVIVGHQHSIKEAMPGVHLLGHVDQTTLMALYTTAEALVYPTLYEGFGLPILEAFDAGIPVVTSNISSLPEVAQDAAILVDPFNVGAIKKGIIKAMENRDFLIKKGKEKLTNFSWEETARLTMEVYHQL